MLEAMLPPWWDFLTVLRIGTLLPLVVAWFFVGWLLGPWIQDRFLDNSSGYVTWMVETFDKMFMQISARLCVGFILVSMLLSVGIGLLLMAGLPYSPGYHFLRFVLCLVLVIGPGLPIGYNLPRFVVKRMWAKRIEDFEEQMLDALSFMSNGLKSGLSLVQCMEMVRAELPAPVSEEFGLVLSEQRLGVLLEDALLNLEDRLGTEDLQIMVTSINILRQSGGNLSETFDTISDTIRERRKVEGRIRTLTAQGVAQGFIIVLMPFVLGAVLYFLDPELIARLWTTWMGWGMLALMFTLQGVGALLMRKIVQIRV